VGQWLGFGWFWGQGTLDMRLTRQKLAKNNTPQSWWPPSHYGHHGAFILVPPHTAISQLANMLRDKSMLLKLENIIFFYYLLAILRHDTLLMRRACSLRVASAGGAESIILSGGSAESMMLSVPALRV
jgi:hypothetical protein